MSYLKWLESFLKKFGVKSGTFLQEVDEFHEIKGENLRLYDHVGHMYRVSGRDWNFISGEVENELAFKPKDFCYGDVHDFLNQVSKKYEVRLLSYGDGEYQRFKMNKCDLLRDLKIPIHVVHEPKGEFIRREFSQRPGILIDDKAPINLPNHWLHVWINRKTEAIKPIIRDVRVTQISTLSQYHEAIKPFALI